MSESSEQRSRRLCGLNLVDSLRIISSLLLPLTLGIFTVVLTFHQQNVATKQRAEDRQLAREQREQDLNISREQRQQDLNMFALQREQDLNISREQRKLDKELAEQMRKQEEFLAEKQRNLSEKQQVHERNIAQQQVEDSLLVAYMNDIAYLLHENNGTLTGNLLVSVIARAKTLAAIRRLDASRNSHLIRFLYEAKQLTNGNNPLDLSGAELNGIHFDSVSIFHGTLRDLSLVGAFLRNSSFRRTDLSNSNFSGSDLTDAHFSDSKLDDADLSNATLVRANFNQTFLTRSRFDFSSTRRATFGQATIYNTTFIHTELNGNNFYNSDVRNAQFNDAILEGTNFDKSFFQDSSFKRARISKVSFVASEFKRVDFTSTQLKTVNFTKSRFTFTGSSFSAAQLMSTTFVQVYAKNLNLTGAKMESIDFSEADLSLSTLSHTVLNNAKFIGANVTMANFSFASMIKANISDKQLLSAISLRGATLPNGTKVNHDPNMLHNGHADCHQTSLNNAWQVNPPNAIVILPEHNSPNNCIFVNQIDGYVNMSQRMNLVKYKTLISERRIMIVAQGRVSGKIGSVHLVDHFNKSIVMINITQSNEIFCVSIKRFVSLVFILELETFIMRAQFRSYEPQLIVQFTGYGWCDELQVTFQAIPQS